MKFGFFSDPTFFIDVMEFPGFFLEGFPYQDDASSDPPSTIELFIWIILGNATEPFIQLYIVMSSFELNPAQLA